MRAIFILFFVVFFVSCRKDPVNKAKPIAGLPVDTMEAPGDLPFAGDLDLNGIKFTPSTSPLVLVSRAYGRDDGSGRRKEVLLSASGWTHPSVVHLSQPWNGYSYWMAITPYPNIDSQFENPHIFCSQDGEKWIEPRGIKNPIEPCPDADGAYNSDVNLLMDDNTLYCYFRVSGVFSGRAMYVTKSTDGIRWSQKQFICDWPMSVIDVISPSVVKDDGKYHCYGICMGEKTGGEYFSNISIRRMVSSNPDAGFKPERDTHYNLVNINGRPWGAGQDPWHLEVQKLNKIWLMLVTTTNHGGYGSGGRLFLGYSKDGINFIFGRRPVLNASGTYKSSFYPSYNPVTKKIHIELWRATMWDGWTVYYDQFDIRTADGFPV